MGITWEEFKEANEWPLPLLEDHNVAGQTVIVTGANTGIGYEVTKYMAKYGASKIIAVCRNEAKGQNAIARLAQETGRDIGDFECWPLDFTSLVSVRRFAKRYNESGLALHIFIHNVGMNGIGQVISEDGFDLILQVNYIAPALLLMLLYPALERTGTVDKAYRACFLWVMSKGSTFVPFDESADAHPIKALNKKTYELANSWQQYFMAKLICLMACHEYARCIPSSTNFAIVAVALGLVVTELRQKDIDGDNFQPFDLKACISVQPRKHKEGARTIVLAATYPVEVMWKVRVHCVPFLTSMQEMALKYLWERAGDEELQKKIWADTIHLLELTDGEVDSCFL